MTPKDKENIEILVKSIIEKDIHMVHVKDSALIPYYLSNSKYMIEIEPEDKSELRFLHFQGHKIEDDFNGIKSGHLELAKNLSANYIFASTYHENRGVLISVANPFRIISDKEEEFLLKNFYKDVPENVSKAARGLELILYDKLYSHYFKGDINEMYNALRQNSYGFINFVFGLPYEEQNIESNKNLLQEYSSGDLIHIITKEYSEGKHFKEYFEAFGHYFSSTKVVEALKDLERKPDNDVYIFKKGFVLGEDSAIRLYRQDAQGFMNYFQKLGDESRKIIIEKIYEDSFINQDVVDWLEKSYTDILREVGFSGGKQNGSNS